MPGADDNHRPADRSIAALLSLQVRGASNSGAREATALAPPCPDLTRQRTNRTELRGGVREWKGGTRLLASYLIDG